MKSNSAKRREDNFDRGDLQYFQRILSYALPREQLQIP